MKPNLGFVTQHAFRRYFMIFPGSQVLITSRLSWEELWDSWPCKTLIVGLEIWNQSLALVAPDGLLAASAAQAGPSPSMQLLSSCWMGLCDWTLVNMCQASQWTGALWTLATPGPDPTTSVYQTCTKSVHEDSVLIPDQCCGGLSESSRPLASELLTCYMDFHCLLLESLTHLLKLRVTLICS